MKINFNSGAACAFEGVRAPYTKGETYVITLT